MQSDERLIALIRRGNTVAFEVLVSRYHARLLAFCRHLLGSREDAEDVLQEVFSAAFNAILDDDRAINVRPWLYRIARNRSLNHLRRIQAVGVDSMDIHLYDHGATTADKVHEREEFRLLVGDIHGLPETQRTALVLREMDALSYEQIAEAMETTVPSVKSLLVRARVSLAEAAQARMLTCEQVRIELGEVAEGLRRRPGALVRRHLRTCDRCSTFKGQLGETSKALTAILPIGFAPLMLLRKLTILHLGHSAGAGAGAGSSASGATAAGQAAAVGSTAAAGATAVMSTTGGGFLSASVGAIATKAAAGLAAAALVTAGAVEVDQPARRPHHLAVTTLVATVPAPQTVAASPAAPTPHVSGGVSVVTHPHLVTVKHLHGKRGPARTSTTAAKKPTPAKQAAGAGTKPKTTLQAAVLPGRIQTQTDPTVLAQPTTPSVAAAGAAGATTDPTSTTTAAAPPPPTTSTVPVTTTITPPQSTDTTTTTTTTTATTTTTTTTSSDPTPTTTTTSPATSPSPETDTTTSPTSSTPSQIPSLATVESHGVLAPWLAPFHRQHRA